MTTCALVSKAGSIDWLCMRDFDSPAVVGRILDWHRGGHFQVAPQEVQSVDRRYLPGTNVLETTFWTETGVAKLTDFMVMDLPDAELTVSDGNRWQLSGSFDVLLPTDKKQMPPIEQLLVPFHAEDTLRAGEKAQSVVTSQPFFLPLAEDYNEDKIEGMLEETVKYWEEWSERCSYDDDYRDDVLRSALALKALTYNPSGAILAAPTTSLPESPAGERNWDYRFTWIRDATLSLGALSRIGYKDEARAFKRWMEWTAAFPEDLQIMYGLRGERWLTEVELPLEGYKWSTPVRVGNGAASQFQLDIYGEILDSAYIYRDVVLPETEDADNWEFETGTEEYDTEPDYWQFLAAVVEFVIENWRRPDAGLWESRAGYRHFVYSKVMCWVALDRGIKLARELVDSDPRENYDISDEQLHRWEKVRDEIKDDVLANGYDPNYKDDAGAFVQFYGSKNLDASNLKLPMLGFIEADDPRMRSTIEMTRQDLTSPEGFVYRYSTND